VDEKIEENYSVEIVLNSDVSDSIPSCSSVNNQVSSDLANAKETKHP
jgi:hypothetical protein